MKIIPGVIRINMLLTVLIIIHALNFLACKGDHKVKIKGTISDSTGITAETMKYRPVSAMLVLPKNPGPGVPFRILATGGENIENAKIILNGPGGKFVSQKSKAGNEFPWWRIDDFTGIAAGRYKASLISGNKVIRELEFEIATYNNLVNNGAVWKTLRGWDSGTETIYSAWINALFHGCSEQDSWSALHEVTSNQNQNFLYNYLSQGEDDKSGKNYVMMQPDCADNPFFLRAYFAWKLGLPFGFHICDRGYLGRNPKTGQWVTNESTSSKTNPVSAFNYFIRRVADGVHSGTARTAMEDENSDYYPVALEKEAIRPGLVFADPYGHTLTIVGYRLQTSDTPGLLLAVDAQPDGTVGIKRFWKGNFLFNTSGVIGEPGFKAFRPILTDKGNPRLIQNKELLPESGYIPFSLQQNKMGSDVFYKTMERIINPKPLDPEMALLDLIAALHEQLLVRVISVANGEAFFKTQAGTVIPMPSTAAGIFLAGGQWENFSTPNRDLRLLIAMDAVQDFPELVAHSPEDFNIPGQMSPGLIREKLQRILEKKSSELSISYNRTDGSLQKLTVGEILKRKDAFEMAYNPNDGVEIRWGAPEDSNEIATCKRHAPARQLETMRSVRLWFSKRLHPPT